jgi:glycosyltransferase involved in cell wall biosynthesis
MKRIDPESHSGSLFSENSPKYPLVSIGIPVYNAESTITACIESALSQNYANFEILISDNASSDATSEICKNFQNKDGRIRYFRQEQNIGALSNFHFVLEKSNGWYFRWLGSDDVISSNSVSESVKSLEHNTKFVACAAPTFFDFEYLNAQVPNNFRLGGSQYSRIQSFFTQPGRSHGLTYSLIKRDLLIKYPLLGKDFFGWDWCLVLYLLSNGPIAFAQSASLILGSNGASSTDAIYRQYNLIGLKRVLPFWRFTVLTIQSGKEWAVGARFLLYLKLVAFNLKNLCKEFRIVRQILAKINNK